MKQVLFLSALVILAASCISKTKHAEELSATRDSINAVVETREAEISKFLTDFNDIQMNLDSIKEIEKLISLKSDDSEMSISTKDQIINDFSHMQQLLAKNKEIIKDLKWLRSKDLKKNKALMQTIALLENQLLEKDSAIAVLNNNIEALNIDVSELKSSVEALKVESDLKSQALLAKEDKMNQVWYTFGSKDSLIANKLIEKKGGFLGLGKTVKLAKNLDKSNFIMLDLRTFQSIELNVEEASLLSVHPEGSYHFERTETSVESLIIDAPTEFWSISKYMVIMTE